MLSTQPPVANLKTGMETEWPVASKIEVGIGATLVDLYLACCRDVGGAWRPLDRSWMDEDMKQTKPWVHLASHMDVDIVTGSKMLEILDMSFEQLRDEGLL